MQTYDLIQKTRRKEPLTEAEICFLVDGFTKGVIPDYMMSAWMMAVCCQGLTTEETSALTLAMRDSGDCLDLSTVGGVTVDKHSTGGIGDKTTLLVAPIVAACGGYVPKMSGKGLGFTGGTIDKLESIPGFSVTLSEQEFLKQTREIGCAVISQSGNLTPADKKMYALRNLTATVDSIPLICASIMSKKLALGADCIVLDVKYGSGAFMKTAEDAAILAKQMVDVAKLAGKKCRAVITDMNAPLGCCVGNALEVEEVIHLLHGEEQNRVTELSLALAAQMLFLSGKGDIVQCYRMAEQALTSGEALVKFGQMVAAQGGDPHITDHPDLLPKAACEKIVTAPQSGYIRSIHSEEVGLACLELGAGRTADHPSIDYGAGVRFCCGVGDAIEADAPLCTVYGSTQELCDRAEKRLLDAIAIRKVPPQKTPLIHTIIG